jgi:pimeloyl-ACP methyl ester carboxylesterase
MPALQGLSFGGQEAGRIRQPVLFLIGDESIPPFGEVQQLLAKAFPQMVTTTIAGGTHLHDIEKPGPTAKAIADFLRANPMIGVSARH